ncbi:MAG: carbohydrate kinase, partial [Chloroflexi bacterium]|nr:carbohydrate kinase [Chloroflexota bacterium]
AILWNDGRAADIITRWQDDGVYRQIFEHSGTAPFPGSILSSIRWVADAEPQILKRTRWLLFHKDWLRYSLTGELHHEESDVGYAPGDIHARVHSRRLFELCGINEYWDRFPTVIRSQDVVGGVTRAASRRVGLRPGTPVVAGAVDVVASALGGGVFRPGQACSILGTSFLNSLVVAQPTFEPLESGAQTAMPEGSWLRSVINTSGTINIDWLVNNLAAEERANAQATRRSVYELIEETVSKIPPGAGGVIYHPYLSTAGIISPFAEPAARAQFFGISAEHTRAHLMRAIYEGTALAMRDGYDSIGQPVDDVTLVGGGSRSAFWAQMFADATERRITVVEGSEGGAHGVAMLAGIGVGLYRDLADAVSSSVRVAASYSPRPGQARAYRAVYGLYRHLYLNAREAWRLRRTVLSELDAASTEEELGA